MANRTVSVALVADVGQYQSAMVRAAATTKGVGDSATVAGDKARRGFDMAGRSAALLGAVAAGGLALGLKAAVSAASDAEQSIGGVQAVFKNYATSVIASSKEADRALGLSANSYRELATIIGSQMKNAGVPLDELADKTEGIIGIGADLAAQFGGSTQSAVEALSSAFRGELDPIERYGISLTAAAVGAKAVEMGLSESATGLSQNAKAMATLALITEQSADAQGAFGRESDTAAGRAQRAAAQWENLKVAVGDRLLPAWSALADVLGTHVIPALGDVLDASGAVIGFLGDLGRWAGDNVPLVAALGTVLAIQLAGGITAVTVAANRMVLTPLVLGLSGLLGVAGSLPAAFAAAKVAVAGFVAAAAPLIAIGAVVGAVTAIWEIATAGSRASEEVAGMWAAVENAGSGTAQVEALNSHVAHLRAGIAELRENLSDDGAWETTILGAWLTGAAEDQATLDAYVVALERAEEAQGKVEASASVMGRRFGLTRDQVLDLASKYDIDLTGSMSNTFRLMQNFYATEFGSAPTEAVINLAESTEVAKDAFDDAKQAVDGFKLSLDILTGTHVSLLQVEASLHAALADSKDAMDELGGAVLQTNGQLNLQSANGREAADVLLGIRDSGNQLIATMIQQGATAEQVQTKDAQLRQSFINSAIQMGINRQAAENLADQILGIPDSRNTTITADTAAANAAIAATQRGIDNMHGRDILINVKAAGRFIVNPQGGLQEFADGGWTGPGSKYTPAGIVHADEFVVPKSRVNALGGPGRVGALVGMPGYAEGGPVLPINVLSDSTHLSAAMESTAAAMKSAQAASAGAGAVGGAWGSLWQLVKSQIPSARINSTFRAGDPGYHGKGKAIDFGFGSGPGGAGSAGLASINRLLHDQVGRNLAELIYDGIGDDRPDLKNGRPLTYSASTQAQHRNHVHAAVYDQGGPLEPGYTLAFNGTGQREWVSREMPGSGSSSGGGGAPSMAGLRIVGTLDLGGGLEGRIEGVVVSTLTAAGDRGRFNP